MRTKFIKYQSKVAICLLLVRVNLTKIKTLVDPYTGFNYSRHLMQCFITRLYSRRALVSA